MLASYKYINGGNTIITVPKSMYYASQTTIDTFT